MTITNLAICYHATTTAQVPVLHIVHNYGYDNQWTGCDSHATDFVVAPITAENLKDYRVCRLCGDPSLYVSIVEGKL